MPQQDGQSCGTCGHYLVLERECHQGPPVPFLITFDQATGANKVVSSFPPTKPTNWCGQWTPEAKKVD